MSAPKRAPSPRSASADDVSEPEDVGGELLTKPSAWVVARRPLSGTPAAVGEVKFYETTYSPGIMSANTWNEIDALASIVAGTGQNQRLGRRIRLLRMRVVVRVNMNADSTAAFIFGKWKDQTVAGSDLFSTSGSTRSEMCAPNPTCVVDLFEHRCGTLMEYVGAAYGTTPSYVKNNFIFDHRFRKGMPIVYDVAGTTLGAYPSLWHCWDETSVSPEIAVEYWYTDE